MENDKITFVIDKDLKTKLKIIAVKNNTSITQIMLSLVNDFVNENE